MKNGINVTQANLSRRDFGKLTAAAFGGVLLGSALSARAADKDDKHDPELLLQDKHVCRGLNTCKGKGKGAGSEAGCRLKKRQFNSDR